MNKGIYEIYSSEELEKLVSSLEGTTFVDFYSQTCGPCLMLEPIFEEMVKKGDINWVKVNVMEAKDLAMKFNIAVTPTILIFNNKKQKHVIRGYQPKSEWKKLI